MSRNSIVRRRLASGVALLAVTAVSLGAGSAQAADDDAEAGTGVVTPGPVWGWGANTQGQVGTGTLEPVLVPTELTGLYDVVEVVAGGSATYGIDSSGDVYSWGWNDYGALGNGLSYEAYGSGKVLSVTDAVSVAARNGGGALALTSDGDVWSWGMSRYGEAGRGDAAFYPTPAVLAGLPPVAEIYPDVPGTVAVRTRDGEVWAWGEYAGTWAGDAINAQRSTPTLIPGLSNIVSVSTAGPTLFAVDSEGFVWAVGYGWGGFLGDGQESPIALHPVKIPLINDAVRLVDCWGTTAYAIASDGGMWTWGSVPLNDPEQPSSWIQTPFKTDLPADVVDIAAFGWKGYALTSDGNVWAWSSSSGDGDLGNGTNDSSRIPVQVHIGGVVQIATSIGPSYAIREDGTLWVWGGGFISYDGLGGDPYQTEEILTPTNVPGVGNVRQVESFWYDKWIIADWASPEITYPPGLGWGGEPVTDLPGWLGSWTPPSADPPVPWSSRTYVALGDSFQSGEGTFDYYDNTNVYLANPSFPISNMCHRSPRAYPSLLNAEDAFGGLKFEFWACSGSTAPNMSRTTAANGYQTAWNDPLLTSWDTTVFLPSNAPRSALSRLNSNTAVVTVGIGGNDLDLPLKLQTCVTNSAGQTLKWLAEAGAQQWLSVILDKSYSCADDLDNEVATAINDHLHTWTKLFDDIHQQAPNARIYVTGYPRLFEVGGSTFRCVFVRPSDQVWANGVIAYINKIIKASVEATAKKHVPIEYIDVYDVGMHHELCGPEQPFVNDIVIDTASPLGPAYGTESSFHPNVLGHEFYRDAFDDQAVKPEQAWMGSIRQIETLASSFIVEPATTLATSVVFRGSDVVATLISPSGVRYDRTSTEENQTSDHGATWDDLEITNPEPGTWTVELYGAQIDPGGEPFEFRWFIEPLPNEAPVAIATAEQDAATVTVDGASSYDPDGSIVDMAFDFGDGTVLHGTTATHTYTEAGPVLVTMWVEDDRGDYGFGDAGSIITIPASAAGATPATGVAATTPSGLNPAPSASVQASPSASPVASASPSVAASATPGATVQAGPPASGSGSSGPSAWLWAALGLLVVSALAIAASMLGRRSGGSA